MHLLQIEVWVLNTLLVDLPFADGTIGRTSANDMSDVFWNIHDQVFTLATHSTSLELGNKPSESSVVQARGVFLGHFDTLQDVEFRSSWNTNEVSWSQTRAEYVVESPTVLADKDKATTHLKMKQGVVVRVEDGVILRTCNNMQIDDALESLNL